MKTNYYTLSFWKIALSILFSFSVFLSSSQSVIISQVYAGGGTSGATYNSSYIQLFNLSPVPVNINGWSLQWGTGNGTGGFTVITLPNVTVPSFQAFLVTGQTYSQGAAIPGSNFSSSNFHIATAGGKIALVNNTNALAGNICVTSVVDFFGYGVANCAVGTAFPALSNTSAAIRRSIANISNNTSYFSSTPIPFSIPFVNLPLKLINFSATETTSGNLIQWEAEVYDHASFELQRSDNGNDFYTINTSVSNISGQSKFNYLDKPFTSSKQYYRLKLTDELKTVTYSNIIIVTNSQLSHQDDAFLYPTVTSGILNVQYRSTEKKTLIYSILSIDGKILLSGTLNCLSNQSNFSLNTSAIKCGHYILRLQDQKGFEKVLRFIKQ